MLPFQTYADYEIPLLQVLATLPKGQGKAQDVVTEIERQFGPRIPPEHRVPLENRPRELKWQSMVYWTRNTLVTRGLSDTPAFGIWRITDAGRVYLAQIGDSSPLSSSPPILATQAQPPDRTTALTLQGAGATLTAEQVLDAARREIAQGLPPEALKSQSWVAEVDGQTVGLKWLFGLATGLSHADFEPNDARRALQRLGITVRRAESGVRGKAVAEVSTFAGKPGRPHKETRVETLTPAHEIIDARIAAVRDFLSGRANRPSDERLCDWVHLCYELELYREGRDLFALIDPSQVNTWYYERAKRLARVCAMKAAGQA